ncbi:MAG: methionine gamma-lyase [Rhodospirillaceae bacterium]|nr:methionine gamma-lyase [Rhodospirillaceae bacterium]
MTDRKRDRRNAAPGFATRAIHEGYDPADEQGALTPPIYMTSTYAFESAEAGGELFRGERAGYIYGRTRNPTQALLETRMASLEGGEAAVAFASGIGAITSMVWSLVSAGDDVIVDHTIYGSSYAFFMNGLTRFGVTVQAIDLTEPENIARALKKNTKLVFFETPANPNLRIIDIAAIAKLAKPAGALVAVDNTFCSPALQRPLEFGADLVVHSATKYLGGHGDLLGGVCIGSTDLMKQVRLLGLRSLTGATLSPINAFLILRGLKTLKLRLERHSQSAHAIAEAIQDHPSIDRLDYPGLASFAGHALAKKQMSAFGGMISLELKGGMSAGLAFMNRLELVTRAVSLGDAETLVQHPASMTHSTYSAEERAQHGIGDGLIRLSVGLEEVEDLVADILQALDGAKTGISAR